jgi:hypothetical protein
MPKRRATAMSCFDTAPSVVADEASGKITITVMGHGLTTIVLMPDGDVLYEGRSIISPVSVPVEPLPIPVGRTRPQ